MNAFVRKPKPNGLAVKADYVIDEENVGFALRNSSGYLSATASNGQGKT